MYDGKCSYKIDLPMPLYSLEGRNDMISTALVVRNNVGMMVRGKPMEFIRHECTICAVIIAILM